MKREFFNPEMKISTFSLENVVTTSGNLTFNSDEITVSNEANYGTAGNQIKLDFLKFSF